MRIRGEFLTHRHVVFLIVMALSLYSPAAAQRFLGLKVPEAQVFAGYSLERYDTVPFGFSNRLNLNGANIELALPNLYQGLGVVADFSGHYSGPMKTFNFLGGPQYRYEVKGMYVFGHALFGKSRTRLLELGTSQLEPSTLGGTAAMGGGIDIPLWHRFSFRAIQADYLISSQYGERRHNMRYSSGLVVTFGKRKEAPSF